MVAAHFLLGAASITAAQVYQPMLRNDVIWSNAAFGFSTTLYSTTVGNDTLIDGVVFKRMLQQGDPVTSLIQGYSMHEDTMTRKVFVHFDGQTHLAFDFATQPSDTVEVFGESLFSPSTLRIVLDSITSTPPSGTACFMGSPRFFYFHDIEPGWDRRMVWLEGVGSLTLPPDGACTGHGFLACHHTVDGAHTFEDSAWMALAFDSCDQVGTYNALFEREAPIFSVTPIPTCNKLFIRFRSAAVLQGEFVLLNGVGQVVQWFEPGGSSVEIDYDIGHLPAGIYLLQYRDANGVRWAQRVIKD